MISILSALQAWMANRTTDDRGATMVEYGLMLALIAVICIAGVRLIGANALAMFNGVAADL
jgi:pilus assembly protein Flp/PilA